MWDDISSSKFELGFFSLDSIDLCISSLIYSLIIQSEKFFMGVLAIKSSISAIKRTAAQLSRRSYGSLLAINKI